MLRGANARGPFAPASAACELAVGAQRACELAERDGAQQTATRAFTGAAYKCGPSSDGLDQSALLDNLVAAPELRSARLARFGEAHEHSSLAFQPAPVPAPASRSRPPAPPRRVSEPPEWRLPPLEAETCDSDIVWRPFRLSTGDAVFCASHPPVTPQLVQSWAAQAAFPPICRLSLDRVLRAALPASQPGPELAGAALAAARAEMLAWAEEEAAEERKAVFDRVLKAAAEPPSLQAQLAAERKRCEVLEGMLRDAGMAVPRRAGADGPSGGVELEAMEQ
jgi:hypothetical protein